jgi:hypothetical protein
MQSVDGMVTIVQEGRFQLIDDDGVGHLFLLGHAAALDPEQLAPLQRDQTRVRVSYRYAPDLIAHVADKIVQVTPRCGGPG